MRSGAGCARGTGTGKVRPVETPPAITDPATTDPAITHPETTESSCPGRTARQNPGPARHDAGPAKRREGTPAQNADSVGKHADPAGRDAGNGNHPSKDLLKSGCGETWATWLSLLVIGLLLPTGFAPQSVYWDLTVLLAGGFVLVQLLHGEWPFPDLDCLSLMLLTATSIAGLQLLMGRTEIPFFTLNSLLFFGGSVLLLALFQSGLVRRVPAQGAALLWFPAIIAGGSALLFAVALSTGLAGVHHPNAQGPDGPIWWPFVYRNHLAAFVVLLLPILMWRLLFSNLRQPLLQWMTAGAIVLGLASVVASGSRAGICLAIAEIVTIGLVAAHHLRGARAWTSGVVLAGLAVLAVAVGGTTVIGYRLQHEGSVLEGRIDYWHASIEMIAARPGIGWGFGTWPDVYREFQVADSGLTVNRAHSDWLEWTAEGGVGVAVALLALLLEACRLAVRSPWALGLPVLLVYGMMDYTLRQPLVWVAFLVVWLAAGRSDAPSGCLRECQELALGSGDPMEGQVSARSRPEG